MILPIITYNDMISKWYNLILTQSGLTVGKVLNKASINGVDLYQLVSTNTIDSISHDNSFILFEVIENGEDELNYIMENNASSTDLITSYKLRINIYGDGSHTLSHTILGRLKNDEILTTLRENGIFARNIPMSNLTREFINNLLWDRCDIEIDFVCRHNVTKLSPTEEFNSNSLKKLSIDNI